MFLQGACQIEHPCDTKASTIVHLNAVIGICAYGSIGIFAPNHSMELRLYGVLLRYW